MSSVNPIQINEPRVQPANTGGPARGGDPFEALLESASATRRPDAEPRGRQEPSAPRPRSEARSEALTRNDMTGAAKRPGNTESGTTPGEAGMTTDGTATEPASDTQAAAAQDTEPAAEETALPPDDETELQTAATAPADTEAEGEAEAEAVALPAIDGEAMDDDDTADGDSGAADQAPVQAAQVEAPIEQAVDPLTGAMVETSAETSDQPAEIDAPKPVQAASAAPVTPAPAADNSPDIASVPAAAAEEAAPVQAAVSPAPAAGTDAETPDQLPPQPAPTRAASPSSEQTQSQPAQQSGLAAALAEEGAMPAFDEGGNEQLQQRPNTPQPASVKPNADVKPEQFAEAVKPASAAPETASAKPQLEALPEPLRALASTLNTPSANAIHFRAASLNERVPIPLNPTALAAEIVSRARDGMQRFEIRLDPPELGRIDVRLEVDRAGNVKTRLTVDRPETLDLMQREARGLERALQQSGLKTDSGGLEFSLRSHAEQGGHDGQAGRGGRERDAFMEEGGERIEAVIENYRAAALARGGVDIRI